jgi:hypothetical protein
MLCATAAVLLLGLATPMEAVLGSGILNVSVRGYAGTGVDALSPGLVITGEEPVQVLVRVKGPSLPDTILNRLLDPEVTVWRLSSTAPPVQVATNDNWEVGDTADLVRATGLAPESPLEPALVLTLAPGAYSAVVGGAGGTTGIALPSITRTEVTADGEPIDLLVGRYALSGFVIKTPEGETYTEEDVASFSGNMTIESDGYVCQTVTIEGFMIGPYCGFIDVVDENTMVDLEFWCSEGYPYSYDPPVLTIEYPRYMCAVQQESWGSETWTKYSTKHYPIAEDAVIQRRVLPMGSLIGEALR